MKTTEILENIENLKSIENTYMKSFRDYLVGRLDATPNIETLTVAARINYAHFLAICEKSLNLSEAIVNKTKDESELYIMAMDLKNELESIQNVVP